MGNPSTATVGILVIFLVVGALTLAAAGMSAVYLLVMVFRGATHRPDDEGPYWTGRRVTLAVALAVFAFCIAPCLCAVAMGIVSIN